MAEQDMYPDLQHKMSKKIAQLTKVIYHLNTKNDDHDIEMKQLNENHDNEISSILKDARERIMAFKKSFDEKQHREKMEAAMTELQRRHDREKDECVRQYERFKMDVLSKETKIQQACDTKVKQLLEELHTVKGDFQQRVNQFQALSMELEKNSQAQMMRVGESKNKEIEDLVMVYNAKYKAMLAEQMEQQVKIKQELEGEFNERLKQNQLEEDRKRKALQQQIERLQEQLKELSSTSSEEKKKQLADHQAKTEAKLKEIQDLQNKNSHLTASVEELTSKLFKLEEEFSRYKAMAESQAKDYSEQSEALKKELDALRHQIQSAHSEKAALSNESSATTAQLREAIQSLTRQLEEEQLARRKSEESLATAHKEFDALRASLKSQIDVLETERSKWESMANSLKQEISDLGQGSEERIKQLMKERNSLLEEVKLLKDEHAVQIKELEVKWSQAIAKEKQTHEQFIEEKNKTHDAAILALKNQMILEKEEALKALREEFASKLSEKDKSESSSAEVIKKLHGQIESLQGEITQLKADHSSQLASINEAHRQKEEEERSMHARAIAEIEDRHKSDIEKLREQYESNAKSQGASVEQKVHALQRTISEKDSRIAELEAEAKKLKVDIETITKQSAKVEADLTAMCKSMKSQISELEEKLAKLQNDRRTSEGEAESQRQSLQLELERVQSKLKETEAALAQSLSQGAASNERMTKEIEALKQSLSEEARKASGLGQDTAKLSSDLAATKLSLEKERQERQGESAAASAEIDQLKNKVLKLGKALDEMEQEFKSSLSAGENRVKQLQEASDLQLSNSNEAWKAKLAALEASCAQQIQELNEAHSKTIKDLQDKWKKEGDDLMRSLNHQHDEQTKKLHEAHGLVKSGLAGEIERLKAEIQKTNQKLLDNANEFRNQLAKREKDLREGFEEEKRQIEVRTLERIEAVKDEYEKKAQTMKQNAQLLHDRMKELETCFANRPSREEDLQKVSQLLNTLMERETTIRQLHEEMKFYKLELENREETYNQMFRRQPLVDSTAASSSKPSASLADLKKTKPLPQSGRLLRKSSLRDL